MNDTLEPSRTLAPFTSRRRIAAATSTVAAISAAQWILLLPFLAFGHGIDLEGPLLMATFLGVGSITFTAPAAALVACYAVPRRFGAAAMGGVFILLSLPAVSGEVYIYSSSIMPSLLATPIMTSGATPAEMFQAALLCTAWYVCVFVAILALRQYRPHETVRWAAAIFLASLVIVFFWGTL